MKTTTPTDSDARGLSVLLGLQNTRRHIYGGTVPPAEVRRRRKANRAARRSRRINRGQR